MLDPMDAPSGLDNDLIQAGAGHVGSNAPVAPPGAGPQGAPSEQSSHPPPEADESWDHHYQDERDAAYLYRALAGIERAPALRDLFQKLAVVEDRHAARWEELFLASGRPLPAYRTARRTRLLAWAARRFGTSLVLPMMLAEEGREVQAYLGLARRSRHDRTHVAALEIAADSAVHARELAEAMGRDSEPWHVGGSGGYLRSIVYGFNDGLTANFGLVAGVLGADVAPHVVIISGVAGAIADALSMGSSGYLAAKSESEMHAHQIAIERQEMTLMPDLEEEELAVIYEAKGLTAERARETARAIMQEPQKALDTMVREELNIHPAELAPLRDGLVTGTATAIGAFIPIVPFFVLAHARAVWASLALSMAAHFAIGAARSMFTGRGVWSSGRDMFVVGFGVAAIGYFIGELVTHLL
ncbi:MAG: vacuolar iron transporter family protein [Acidobacteriota bacterium]|jgi:VIT1/CCC1 family predicted Fe2+/Mn2+ transporter/rubrerythrin